MRNLNNPAEYLTNMKVIGAIALFSMLFISCKNKEKEVIQQSVPVLAQYFEPTEVILPVSAIGRLSANSELKLAFKTGGIIRTIPVKEGDFVSNGDLLAALDLQEVKSYYDQAEEAREKARRDLIRAEGLYMDSVAPLELLQNAKTAFDIASNQFDLAEFNLQHSEIRAPGDGWILKKLSNENEVIGPGYPVFLFGQKGKEWKLKVQLADKDLVKLQKGDTAMIRFSVYPDKEFHAVVNSLGAFADPYSGTIEVELKMCGDESYFISGLLGKASIYPHHYTNVYLIPPTAVFDVSGRKGFVYQIVEGKPKRMEVKIDDLTDSVMVITQGLQDKPEIIVKGTSYVKKDSEVKVMNANSTK